MLKYTKDIPMGAIRYSCPIRMDPTIYHLQKKEDF